MSAIFRFARRFVTPTAPVRRRTLFLELLEDRELFSVDLRIAAYNIGGSARTGLDTVLRAIGDQVVNGVSRPVDVLTLEEVGSQATDAQDVVNLLNGIYGSGAYARGTVNGGGDTTQGIVYRTSSTQLIAETAIGTIGSTGPARQTMRYVIRPTGFGTTNDIVIYSSHYKASQGTDSGASTSNANRRNAEAQQIRANADNTSITPANANIIYAGDFNLYTNTETAYTTLTSAGNGQAVDPTGTTDWAGAGGAARHTQSPTTTSRYGGQITGGLDDRFDFQLVSTELTDGLGVDIIPSSYRVLGNNGSTYNLDIDSGSNTWVWNPVSGSTVTRSALLTALASVTDHLPVIADFQIASAGATSSTALTSSANPAVFGQSVTFTATVTGSSGTPTGTVTFFDGATTLGTGTLNGSGVATFATSSLSVATHSITATYGGSGTYQSSTSGAVSQVVNKANTTLALGSSANPSVYGQPVTFTATASATAPGSGTPTGTVTFLDGTTTLGTGTLSGGAATFVTSALTAGPAHNITATYGGSTSFNTSTSSAVSQVVNLGATTTALVSSANPSVFGQSVQFTATVSPVAPSTATPVGTVSFRDNGVEIGQGTLSGGVATFSTTALTQGLHSITAVYFGNLTFAGYNGSTSPTVDQVVNSGGAILAVSFAGGSGSSFAPPDTDGAVGPNHYTQFINGRFAVYNKTTGASVLAQTDRAFWNAAGISTTITNVGVSDPRIVYDQLSSRWFATEINVANTGNQLLVGRSDTSDPSGAWKAVNFTANSGFGDYPTLAIDANALTVGLNNFTSGTGGFKSISVFTIPKADLLLATPSAANRSTVEQTNSAIGDTPQGVTNFSAGATYTSIVAPNTGSSTLFNRTKVTGTGAAGASFQATTALTVQSSPIPGDSRQPDGTRQLDGSDNRIVGVVYQVGDLIYSARGVSVNSSGVPTTSGASTTNAIRVTVLRDSTNTIATEATYFSPTYDYSFPSISANSFGDILIGYTRSGGAGSVNGNAGAYATQAYIDPNNPTAITFLSSDIQLKAGQVNNYHLFGGSGERWGDYSATSPDPSNPLSFWTTQEYAVAANTWGTYVSQVYVAPRVSNVTSTAANGTYGTGATIPITVSFSGNVTVTGAPTLALNSGGTATYASGSGTNTLTFNYTVGAGQTAADLDYSSVSALALNGGTIKDSTSALAATLTLAAPGATGSLGFNKNIVISTTGNSGQFQFSSSTYTTNEGVGTFAATVTRTNGSTGTVTVPFTVTAGTATTPGDFSTITSSPLSFAPGVTSQTIVFSIVDDGSGEANKAFTVALGTPSAGTLGGTSSATVTITDPLLVVTSAAATNSGMVIAFNRGFDASTLNLYDNGAGLLGAADVTLVGSTVGAVRGSLVIGPGNVATFVKTGAVLATDTYALALRSDATDGFRDSAGIALDGDVNGTAGGNYATSLTVSAPTARVVAVPDFARGAGQPVNVPATGTGLPLTLSDTTNVTSVQADILFDSTILNVTAATPTVSGSSVTLTAITGGVQVLVTGLSGAAGTNVTVAALTATVPATAPYSNKQVIQVRNVTGTGTGVTFATSGDDGVQVAAFFGDTNGSGTLSSGDTSLVSQLATGFGTGLTAYQNADPFLIADINGSGTLTSGDFSLILQKAVGLTVALIPDLPTGSAPPAGGPDPRLYLTAPAGAKPGETVTVALRMEVTDRLGAKVGAGDYAVRFDPKAVRVSNVRTGSMLPGFATVSNVDNVNGTIRAGQFRADPLGFAFGADGDVLLFDITVLDGASGSTVLNLAEEVTSNGSTTWTGLEGPNGRLVLVPAPTNAATDPGDFTLAVPTVAPTPAPVPVPVPVPQPVPVALPVPLLPPASGGTTGAVVPVTPVKPKPGSDRRESGAASPAKAAARTEYGFAPVAAAEADEVEARLLGRIASWFRSRR